jgi:hypothetical protein
VKGLGNVKVVVSHPVPCAGMQSPDELHSSPDKYRATHAVGALPPRPSLQEPPTLHRDLGMFLDGDVDGVFSAGATTPVQGASAVRH